MMFRFFRRLESGFLASLLLYHSDGVLLVEPLSRLSDVLVDVAWAVITVATGIISPLQHILATIVYVFMNAYGG
jgi:hypothetical protein